MTIKPIELGLLAFVGLLLMAGWGAIGLVVIMAVGHGEGADKKGPNDA